MQPAILPNATFAHFSEGQVQHGLNPSEPMIPVQMIPAPQMIVAQPTNLVPIQLYNQSQPVSQMTQPWFGPQPPPFPQMGVPISLPHPIMQASVDANSYGRLEQTFPEQQLTEQNNDVEEIGEHEELKYLFNEYIKDFNNFASNWPEEDLPKLQQLLGSIRSAFHAFKETDISIYRTAKIWNEHVRVKLNAYEELEPMNWNVTIAFIDCLNELLIIMEEVSQEIAQKRSDKEFNLPQTVLVDDGEDSYAWKWWNLKKEEFEELPKRLKLIVRFEDCLKCLRRHDFDSQDGLKFSDLRVSVENLKSLVQDFKEAQIFSVCIRNLQSQVERLQPLEFKTMHDFISKLWNEFDYWSERVNFRRLKVWVQVAWEMSELIDSELKLMEQKNNNLGKKKKPKRKRKGKKNKAYTKKVPEDALSCNKQPSFELLTKLCSDCLDFLKTDSFDSEGRTLFSGYDSRHLQIFCLLFKLMHVLGIPPAESTPDGVDNRGKQVVLYRCKREISFGEEAYRLGEFVNHIMKTKAVDIQRCYSVVDHKPQKTPEKKNNRSRRVQGVLFYWIMSSEAEAEKLLQLFVAWCEPKFRRDQVLGQYPELLEMQQDNLTPEQDFKRSQTRQKMVRKEDSMKPGNFPTEQELDAHALQDFAIRKSLCAKKGWSDKDLEDQKKMYHFTFTSKSSQRQASKSKRLTSPLSEIPSSKEFDFPAVAGC